MGCLAPELVLDLTISKGPLTEKLKVRSAFVSFEKVSFLIVLGASSAAIAHFLILIYLPPSSLLDLSMLNSGEIVFALSLSAIVPREPFFGRSCWSSAISISSAESSGEARRIVLKLPTSLVGLNVTLNSWIERALTTTCFGSTSNGLP